jgi:hypothetical protein
MSAKLVKTVEVKKRKSAIVTWAKAAFKKRNERYLAGDKSRVVLRRVFEALRRAVK